MSGSSRLVNSVITGRKGSNSAFTAGLMNANEMAKKEDKKGNKKQK